MRLWPQGLLLLVWLACGGQAARAAANYEPYTFTHFAGSFGGFGSSDGTGSAARFSGPSGVAVDSSGNVYVADSNNNTIRKITPAGVVTTLAGLAGSSGIADGTGSAARFYAPQGVAVDSLGNVYVADSYNGTIRKITPAGVVTTLAGLARSYGSADGTGSAARFNYPSGVAVDSSGNVYVADYWNNTIRKITPSGVVTTLAGLAGSYGSDDGTGSAARFNNPSGVAVDSSGNVYVADTYNFTIRKITPGGVVSTLAGQAGYFGSADGTGSAAQFADPQGVAVDSLGDVYVADLPYNASYGEFIGGNTIRKITPGGAVTTLAGLAGSIGSADGTGSAALFALPSGVAVDSSGNVYVADAGNDTIRQITQGGVVSTLAGLAGPFAGSDDGTGSAARFYDAQGVAVDSSGNVYVADTDNATIRKITPGGVVTTLAGCAACPYGGEDGTGSAARFAGPTGVAVDAAGNVYVADRYNDTIRKITPGGVVTTLAGCATCDPGSADGTGRAARFNGPSSLAVDSSGNIYVADTFNSTIRKITPGGVVSTPAALAGFGGSVAVDSSGNIYVAGSTIRKITPGGVGSTLAGLAGSIGSDDGTGSAARFDQPLGVAVDSLGNVYVADTQNQTIRKITPGGVVTTLAGLAEVYGSDDGSGSAARFDLPWGVAVDSLGNVYVADYYNYAIRKGRKTSADLSISNGGMPDIVLIGETVTYTLSVTNSGPDTADGTIVTDTLPDGVTFVSASPGCSNASGTVTCSLGSLASGASGSITIVVTANTPGVLTNSAVVNASTFDPVPDNNSADATTIAATPCDLIGELIASVEASALEGKHKRPLMASLAAACDSFARGSDISGLNQLNAFQNKLQAQIARLDPALADEWAAAAQQIVDLVVGLDSEAAPHRKNQHTRRFRPRIPVSEIEAHSRPTTAAVGTEKNRQKS